MIAALAGQHGPAAAQQNHNCLSDTTAARQQADISMTSHIENNHTTTNDTRRTRMNRALVQWTGQMAMLLYTRAHISNVTCQHKSKHEPMTELRQATLHKMHNQDSLQFSERIGQVLHARPARHLLLLHRSTGSNVHTYNTLPCVEHPSTQRRSWQDVAAITRPPPSLPARCMHGTGNCCSLDTYPGPAAVAASSAPKSQPYVCRGLNSPYDCPS